MLAGLIAGAWNGGRDAIFSVSVAVTSVAMFGDLIIFKNPKVFCHLVVLRTGRSGSAI